MLRSSAPLPTVPWRQIPSAANRCCIKQIVSRQPAAWMSRMIGSTLATNCAACARRATSDRIGCRALAAARATFSRFRSYLPKPHCAHTMPRQRGRPTLVPTA